MNSEKQRAKLAGQGAKSPGSEGDKESLPWFYRQDAEDRWEGSLTKEEQKAKALTLGYYSGNFHLCLVTWAGSKQRWDPNPAPK